MGEERIEMNDVQSSTSSWETLPAIPGDEHIQVALEVLDDAKWLNFTVFLKPWGEQRVTLVHLAAYRGDLAELKRAADLHADLYATDKLGRCALHYAALQGHVGVVQWLLEQIGSKSSDHPQLSLLDFDGRTALHYAVAGKHVDVVKLLVDAGANANACGKGKMPPIYFAHSGVHRTDAEKMLRYQEIIDILVSKNATVEDIDPITGLGVLHHAVELDSPIATKKLISGGADVFQKTTLGKTVVHLAAEAGLRETLCIILDHDPKLLKKLSRSFDVRDKLGWTPLHAAVYGGHLECVRILIKKGSSLANETKDKQRETVLHAIFKRVPNPIDFLTEILDEQVSFADKSYNKVNLNFQIITGLGARRVESRSSTPIPDLKVVFALIEAVPNKDQLAILQHPLLAAFVHLKYCRIIPFTLILFICEVVIGIFLIRHGLCMTSLADVCDIIKSNWIWLSLVIIYSLSIVDFLGYRSYENRASLRYYVQSHSKHSASLLVRMISGGLVYHVMSKTQCESPPCKYDPIELRQIAIMILVFWTSLGYACRQFPLMEDYILIFKTVLWNVLKVIGIFVCFIIGFIYSFSVLLSHTDPFNTPWKAIVKTLVMMTGEYEYDSISSLTNVNNFTVNNFTVNNFTFDDHTDFIQLVFLLFMLLISIVLMNLMVGLAVNDVDKLVKNSRSLRLKSQAEAAIQWRGLRCIFSSSLTRLGCQTTEPTHNVRVDLKSSSCLFWRNIPADVKSALYDVALKNSLRDKRSKNEVTAPRDNTEEILTAIQSSYAALQSTIRLLQCNPRYEE